MARRVFHFEGTCRNKFMLAGANYVRKPLRLNKDAVTLVSFVENNFAEVCEDCALHGWCARQCKNCPIQGAHDQSLVMLATRPQTEIHYHISDCRNVVFFNEPCAKDRGVKMEGLGK